MTHALTHKLSQACLAHRRKNERLKECTQRESTKRGRDISVCELTDTQTISWEREQERESLWRPKWVVSVWKMCEQLQSFKARELWKQSAQSVSVRVSYGSEWVKSEWSENFKHKYYSQDRWLGCEFARERAGTVGTSLIHSCASPIKWRGIWLP